MEADAVVTCFLRYRGDVLLLRRAANARTYPNRWGAVSGYVETDEPRQTARVEIREETGITAPRLTREGTAFTVVDDTLDHEWVVHPFLFEVDTPDVTLTEEASAADWVAPTEILRRQTVPQLWESYERVAWTPDTIAADQERGSSTLSILALEVLRDAAGSAAMEGGTFDDVIDTAGSLLTARPSMAVLRNRINRTMAGATTPLEAERAAITEIDRSFTADAEAAAGAATLLGDTVLTLSRSRTVYDAITDATPAVIVAESRPACEGIDVAEDLSTAGMDVTVCTDAAIPHVVAEYDVDTVLVGADTIHHDGRIVNKTGSRVAALTANRADIPFFVVAATDKISPDPTVHLETGDESALYAGNAPLTVVNPLFDVTPPDLVTGVITERGRIPITELAHLADELNGYTTWEDTDPPT